MEELLRRALRNKDTDQPQTVLYKTAFLKPFTFFSRLYTRLQVIEVKLYENSG